MASGIKRIDNPRKNAQYMEWLCLAIMVIKIGSLLIFNLTRLKYVVDYDSSAALAQVMEIWKQKTLFLENWAYQTNPFWDSSVLLAVPFYGITKDIFLSYGLSNNCLILTFVFFFNQICNDLKLNHTYKYFSISLFFTVFTHHQLGYADCLFTNAAYYGWRVLSVIVLLSILVGLSTGRLLRQELGSGILCMFLLFWSGASSGSYVLICGVFPLVLYVIWTYLVRDLSIVKILKEPQFIVLSFSALVTLAGMVFVKILYPGEIIGTSTKELSSADDLLINTGKSLVGILELLGGISSVEHPMIFSKLGIKTLLGLSVVSTLFIATWYVMKKSVRTYTYDHSPSTQYSMMVLWLLGSNFFFLSYANLTYGQGTFEYRYWLLPITPIFLMIGIFLTDLGQCKKTLSQAIFICVFFASILFSVQTTISYYQANNGADFLQEVIAEILEEKNIETLYVVDSTIDARILRILTNDFEIVPVNSDLSLHGWGAKKDGFNNDEIAVLAQGEVVSTNPVLKNACNLQCSFEYRQYNLYNCDAGVFNFHSGLPMPEESAEWDSLTEYGYCITSDIGTINGAGEVASYGNSEGYLFYAPYSESVPGIYDITLHYAIDTWTEGTAGVFDVALDTQSYSAIPLDMNAESVTLEQVKIEAGHSFEARVWVPSGMVVRVQSIEYKREK